MAHHDALTGLPNRVLFLDRLDETLLRVRRYPEILAVLYLDLDQFKNVNDTLGHPAGDKLLVAVADRLRTCLRDCDMVARFGGDEFAVLQIGLAAPHEAGALGERIVTLLSEPYDIDGQQAVIGASVGIALAPADGETAEQLLRNADIALYQAKEDGRRVFRFSARGAATAFEPAERWNSICAKRSQPANSNSIISLSSPLRPASFAASRRCFAGTIRCVALWLRRSSFRSPRRSA